MAPYYVLKPINVQCRLPYPDQLVEPDSVFPEDVEHRFPGVHDTGDLFYCASAGRALEKSGLEGREIPGAPEQQIHENCQQDRGEESWPIYETAPPAGMFPLGWKVR
jgi:hypothetical protein